MSVVVQQCLEADFDSATQTCAAPFWSHPPSSLPVMTIADAQEIGLAIALLLATAWVFRRLARLVDQA